MMVRNGGVVGVACLLAACSSDRGPAFTGEAYEPETIDIPCPITPHREGRPRVMVVDHGFDLRHPAFKDKLAGCYTLSCPDTAADFTPDPDETVDQAAARYSDWLTAPGPDCEVTTKLTLSIDAYIEHIDPAVRSEWNGVMLTKGLLPESSEMDDDFVYELQGFRFGDSLTFEALFTYHGTATAGAIAYDNDVELVVVDRPLGNETTAQDSVGCIEPADVDLQTELLARADVRDAFVHSPLPAADRALTELRRKAGVDIENHSYGTVSVQAVEKALSANGCPDVKLGPLAALLAGLESERDAFLRTNGTLDGAEPLLFQAAGNEGVLTDSAADILDCTPNRVNHALVGSYDIYRGQAALSHFSNYGECVDLFAPGESLVLPGPNGFYAPVSGTSFSAPLAARYASIHLAQTGDAGHLLDDILGERDANRFLPVSLMPAELEFYDDTPVSPPPRTKSSMPGMNPFVFRRPR